MVQLQLAGSGKQVLAASLMTTKSHVHFFFTIRYNNYVNRVRPCLRNVMSREIDRGNVLKIKDEEFMYILKVEGIV